MDDRERLLRLFAHDAWANGETLGALTAAAPPPPRALRIFAHVLGVEQLWHGRLIGVRPACPAWPDWDLAACRREHETFPAVLRAYVEALQPADFSRTVSYTNTLGEPWSNTVEDILEHVIQHGTYHRGQIASDLRAAGREPAITDYIHYVRQGLAR